MLRFFCAVSLFTMAALSKLPRSHTEIKVKLKKYTRRRRDISVKLLEARMENGRYELVVDLPNLRKIGHLFITKGQFQSVKGKMASVSDTEYCDISLEQFKINGIHFLRWPITREEDIEKAELIRSDRTEKELCDICKNQIFAGRLCFVGAIPLFYFYPAISVCLYFVGIYFLIGNIPFKDLSDWYS